MQSVVSQHVNVGILKVIQHYFVPKSQLKRIDKHIMNILNKMCYQNQKKTKRCKNHMELRDTKRQQHIHLLHELYRHQCIVEWVLFTIL